MRSGSTDASTTSQTSLPQAPIRPDCEKALRLFGSLGDLQAAQSGFTIAGYPDILVPVLMSSSVPSMCSPPKECGLEIPMPVVRSQSAPASRIRYSLLFIRQTCETPLREHDEPGSHPPFLYQRCLCRATGRVEDFNTLSDA
jgi:hypothetical protein